MEPPSDITVVPQKDGLLLDPGMSIASGKAAAKGSKTVGKTVKRAVDVLHNWDKELVTREYLNQKPFVLRGLCDHWPALEWTFESVARDYGDTPCWIHRYQEEKKKSYAVQSIESYMNPMKNDVTLRHFLQRHFFSNDGTGKKWSIKECHQMFQHYPDLEYQFFFENFLPAGQQGREKETKNFLWMGNPGSTTGLHTDLIDWNLNLQVIGQKVWKFYAPQDGHLMYEETKSPLQSGEYSPVNPFQINHKKYPNFHQATEYEITVGPGDIVYVPHGWWHAEQSLAKPTMNVSYAIGEPEESWGSWYEGARLVANHYLSQVGEAVGVVGGAVDAVNKKMQPPTKEQDLKLLAEELKATQP